MKQRVWTTTRGERTFATLVATAILILALSACQLSGYRLSPRSEGDRTPIDLHQGSGSFRVEGGPGRKGRPIEVYYHRPRGFDSESPILIVLAGAGRNADQYRNSWVESSEQYGVLILAPEYSGQYYDAAAYNFGNVIQNVELLNVQRDDDQRVYRLKDEDLRFDVNRDPDRWLFSDFDRLFETVADAVGSRRGSYDMFGHSAGGQLLHRLAIFHPRSKVGTILASNSGFYTLPDFDEALPFGIKDTPLTKRTLKEAFKVELVLFLGELDNENETRGISLHTPKADQQGVGRLARGRFFFERSRATAARLKTPFRWKIEVVPDAGHDQALMAKAASQYLYSGNGRTSRR